MRVMRITAPAAALALCAGVAVAQPAETCFIEQNFYYPKEGMKERALEVRTKGSEIRVELGLPAGRLFVVEKATSGHPSSGASEPWDVSYLMSEIEYESEEAAEEARARLLESEEYLAIRKEMGGLLEHFESATWRPAWGGCR